MFMVLHTRYHGCVVLRPAQYRGAGWVNADYSDSREGKENQALDQARLDILSYKILASWNIAGVEGSQALLSDRAA